MPRQKRDMSKSGYAHVIVRGIGKQALFEDAEDYQLYLDLLEKYSKETAVDICAYCLMENHVHLLTYDVQGEIALLMKKMGVAYARHFNWKYARTGHLFQDRFLSEPVENERYLLIVFRYILNNPQKAGICLAKDYAWSSYGLYDQDSFLNLSRIKELIGDQKRFAAFMGQANSDLVMEYNGTNSDEWAKERLRTLLGVQSGMDVQKWDRHARNEAIVKLKRGGLKGRQIQRLTGISYEIILRTLRQGGN